MGVGNWEKAQLPLPTTHDEEFYAFELEYIKTLRFTLESQDSNPIL